MADIAPSVYTQWGSSIGSILSSFGMLQEGQAARQAAHQAQIKADFEAQQADIDANMAIAISQRSSLEAKRQGDLTASRALAVAAASGGGTSDPTIVNILANIRGEAIYRANVALYEGESRARKLRLEAAAGRYGGAEGIVQGAIKSEGYDLAAIGEGLKGVSSVYSKDVGKNISTTTTITPGQPGLVGSANPSLFSKYGGGGPSMWQGD